MDSKHLGSRKVGFSGERGSFDVKQKIKKKKKAKPTSIYENRDCYCYEGS